MTGVPGSPALPFLREAGGVAWLDFSPALGGRVRAGLSTRRGGVSAGPYATLNLGWGTADAAERVAENWRRFGQAAGFRPERLVRCRQVHGARVHLVGAGTPADAGEGDALVTAVPGAVLAVQVADCVPIYLVGGDPPALGVVHAGWRGTLAGVGPAAAAALARAAGVPPAALAAVVGPGIGPCCFRVGAEVADAFARAFGAGVVAGGPEAWRVDLWAANRAALVAAGLAPERVAVAGLCTSCRADLFFSHRRDRGVTGRMAAVAWVPPQGEGG